MIALNVEGYCHDCPEFEPEIEKTEFFAEGETYSFQTEITCAHANRCKGIKQYLIRERNKRGLN